MIFVLGSDELTPDVNVVEPIMVRLLPATSHVEPATVDAGTRQVNDPD
jgi:hypothetical protein